MTSQSVRIILFVAGVMSGCVALHAAERPAMDATLQVLPPGGNLPREQGPLRDHLRKLSHTAFDERQVRYEALKTPSDVEAYQRDLRTRFVGSLGGFPQRTPLNARVTGTFKGNGFRGEKIILESQPGFHVTGLLYLPDTPPPHPVVLMPCGHLANAKAGYQQPAVTLVRSGLAVFCFDPIGQGERRQIPADELGRASEHMLLGVPAIALGKSLATWMIWDAIRSIDYLETRPDLDVSRLGCAGNSGGGMLTSYLMALEPRIVSAAPGCFMTTSRHKNERPGPGDAEQNIHGQYVYGLDLPDFIILHAPQPTLICSATQDYVPIAGAWEAFRQAKRIYARLGVPERVDLVETDAPHGFSVQLREGAARWMRRWLLHKDDIVVETPSAPLPDREVECTPDGQVLRLPGARSIFDLYREEGARRREERSRLWSERSDEERRRVVREKAVVRPLDQLPAVRIEPAGVVHREDYRIEKLAITRPDGLPMPALRFIPAQSRGRVCLYLHGQGKHVDAAAGGPIEKLVREGAEVIAVDLTGCGETAMYPWRGGPSAPFIGTNTAEFFVAYMLGRSFAGMRAEDTLALAREFGHVGGSSRRLELIALEDATIPALHAAALEPQLFSSVRLVRAIDSWERLWQTPVTRRQLEGTVHGALQVYDLPNLRALAGNVERVEPVDAAGRPAGR